MVLGVMVLVLTGCASSSQAPASAKTSDAHSRNVHVASPVVLVGRGPVGPRSR
jgi:hypothetical protein